MAFMGILFFWILEIIKKLMIICSVVFLVAGLLLLKTHPIIAIILLVLSGLNLLCFTVWTIHKKISEKMPSAKILTIYHERIVIRRSVVAKYKKCIETMNIEKLNKLLDKHHELIYFQPYATILGLLDYGMITLNIEMMQCALEHGAVFDDYVIFNNLCFQNSLQHFFMHITYKSYMNEKEPIKKGVTTDKIIDTVRFTLEHGAEVVYEDWNLYERAEKWVMNDGIVSRKDKELLYLIKKYMPENT